MPMRRKKWTEEEEETLIAKYGELLQSGFLSKAKSRERKFEPMAAHVNALFHAQNPVAYPWLWTWKDASTKVQNMRHQYLGVKQKIKKMVPSSIDPSAEHEEYEWGDGLSIWSNFLKYKAVFGDHEADADEFYTTQSTSNPSVSLRHHRSHLHTSHLQQEHRHPQVLAQHHLSATPSPSLPFAHATSFPSESNNDAIHSLPKNFPDAGDGLASSHTVLLVECPKDETNAVVRQVVLDGEPGDVSSGLGFVFHGEGEGDGNNGEEHALKNRGKEYEEPMDNTLDFDRQKRQRYCTGFGSRLSSLVSDAHLLAFISDQFAELHEKEAKREEREMERERRQALFEAERLKQVQEWERERREMEEARRREAERRVTELREQELKFRMLEQQRESTERERGEKMEHERMAWREKMENRAMQHQAEMMQIQMQIAQCLQNSIAVLGGAVSQLAGYSNDVTGQPSSNSTFLSHLLQCLQTQGNGTAHYGNRRATGESSDSQFDVDG